MGFGAVAEVIGWVGGVNSYSREPDFSSFVFFGCFGGAVCLIIGFIYLISGLRKLSRAKAEKRRMQNEQK
jgi:hypothetical protein